MFPRHTDRLLVRELSREDIDAIHAFTSDPLNTLHMIWGPATRKMVRAFVRRCELEQRSVHRTRWSFALVDRVSLELVGISYVMQLPHAPATAQMGCLIRRQDWRKGYANEITNERIRFAFEDLGARQVIASCSPENIASINNMQRHGLVLRGIVPNAVSHRGRSRDSLLFSLENPAVIPGTPTLIAV